MTSFPRTVAGAIGVGRPVPGPPLQLPQYPGPRRVRVVPRGAGPRRAHQPRRRVERRQFLVRAACSCGTERLRELWWVRRMPNLAACTALVVAIIVPFVITQSAHQQAYALILATAIIAVSVTVLTGWAGQLSLGQAAIRRPRRAERPGAFIRGVTLNIGWRSNRLAAGAVRPYWMAAGCPRSWRLRPSRSAWCSPASQPADSCRRPGRAAVLCIRRRRGVFPAAIGPDGHRWHRVPFRARGDRGRGHQQRLRRGVVVGALRVRGLLLAISTMAFAIAARSTSSPSDPRRSGGHDTGEVDGERSSGPLTTTTARTTSSPRHALVVLVIVVTCAEPASAARSSVSARTNRARLHSPCRPTRTKADRVRAQRIPRRTRRAVLAGTVQTFGFHDAFFRCAGLALDRRDCRHRRTRQPAARSWRSLGRRPPIFLAEDQTVPLLTSGLGLAHRVAVHPRRISRPAGLRATQA